MNSFISHFKPWLLAVAVLGAIEVSYYHVARPARMERNAFLDLTFAQEETFQRLVAYEKIFAFDTADPDIIQVGDSSGLHGVQPPLVMSHIPGYNYLNLGVATNLGYIGYYNLAKLQLQRSPNARYLVIYCSPFFGIPRRRLWDGDEKLMAIDKEFVNPFYRFFQMPTLAARREVTDYVYYLNQRLKAGKALSHNRGYLAFEAAFRLSNGWTRETDVEGDTKVDIYREFFRHLAPEEANDLEAQRKAIGRSAPVQNETLFDWRTLSRKSYFDEVYGAFAELAREYGVRLVVIWNPVPESSKRELFHETLQWGTLNALLGSIKTKYPDVIFSDIEFWPDEKFSVFSHVSTPFSHESSHRVGRIMKEIVGNQRPVPRARASPGVVASGIVEIDFSTPYSGYGWTDQDGATNAFPLQYVGPRNKAWIFTAFTPQRAYTVRSVFRAHDSEPAHRMELMANEIPAQKLSSGMIGEDLYVDWIVPVEIVNAYQGWMKLEFDIGAASKDDSQGRRTVSFQRVTAIPLRTH